MKQIPGWLREQQWILSALTSARLLTLSHIILVGKVRKRGLDEWTVRCFDEQQISEGYNQWHRAWLKAITDGVF